MNNLLDIRHVEISYNNKPVVSDINLTVQPKEILCIVGESGSGKTSLLKATMQLLSKDGAVTKGDIFFNGINLLDSKKSELRQIYGTQLGMIWQNSSAALCPIRNIGEQLWEYVREHRQYTKQDKQKVFQMALDLFEKVNLHDGKAILNSYPFELSGGMNQRVGIVFAMILQPKLLFADEPTSALDVTVQAQVLKELLKMRELFGTAIVMITHNINIAKYMADNIAVMHQGKIVEYGNKAQIINNPQTDYTKKLLGAVLYLRRKSNINGDKI